MLDIPHVMATKGNICMAFGMAVRQLRSSLGLSQEELADRAEVHRTYVGGIERGERNPTLTMIHRIARALDVTPAQLIQVEPQEKINGS